MAVRSDLARAFLAAGAAVLLLLAPRASSATVVKLLNFETGDLRQWSLGDSINTKRWSVVRAPVREGQFAGRVELHPEDTGPSGLIRAELTYHPSATTFTTVEHYYVWSVMLDPETPFNAQNRQLAYWEGDGPYIEFRTQNGSAYCGALGKTTRLGPMPAGVWHDFVFHVMWSRDAAVGFVEVFYDGARVVPKTMGATLNPAGQPGGMKFMHMGLLRSAGNPATDVAYFDGMRDVTTMEEAMLGPVPDGGVVATLPDASATARDARPPADAGAAGGPPTWAADAGSGADAGMGPSAPGTGTGAGGAPAIRPSPGPSPGAGSDPGTPAGATGEASGGCAVSQRGGADRRLLAPLLALILALARRRRRA